MSDIHKLFVVAQQYFMNMKVKDRYHLCIIAKKLLKKNSGHQEIDGNPCDCYICVTARSTLHEKTAKKGGGHGKEPFIICIKVRKALVKTNNHR